MSSAIEVITFLKSRIEKYNSEILGKFIKLVTFVFYKRLNSRISGTCNAPPTQSQLPLKERRLLLEY
jgi:hypothetical protein